MPLREKKITPIFFIGLGGCGGSIVNELARKVKNERSWAQYEDLIHFFAMDTDGDDLAKLDGIDNVNRFTLSNFNKPEYVKLKQGKLHVKADPLFTQWWPEWYEPRSTRGKGAGQIRLESRLALYHHLENDSGKIVSTINSAIRRAYDVDNAHRDNKDNGQARIYLYASLAGGTGSGGFSMMACTLRNLLGERRAHRIVGTFVMPNVFKAKGLPPNQFDKIMANGYSALQELELLQSADQHPVKYHFNPDDDRDDPKNSVVRQPPFDQVYLVEEKTATGVVMADTSQIYSAIADSAHAQIFSPILEREGSSADNDERAIKQLDGNRFTKSFGSFGLSALMLPDKDILEYCAVRLGTEALLQAVPGGLDALDGKNADAADAAFTRGVEEFAAREGEHERPSERKLVTWASGNEEEGSEGALDRFVRRCDAEVETAVDRRIIVRNWDEGDLEVYDNDPEGVQSALKSTWDQLEKQLNDAGEGAGDEAEEQAKTVTSGVGGMALDEVVKAKGPTDCRYFYVKLRRALVAKQAAAKTLHDSSPSYRDARIQAEFDRRVDEMKKAAPLSWRERLPGQENDYKEVSSGFVAWYGDTLKKLKARVRANAMLDFYANVIKELDQRRGASRDFFAGIDKIRGKLVERSSALLNHGGDRAAGGEANQFILDVEVLQDHRTGARYWEHFYQRVLKPSDYLELEGALSKIAQIVATGGAKHDVERKIIDELVNDCSEKLRERICGSRTEPGLNLYAELEYEARIATAKRVFVDTRKDPKPGDPQWDEEMSRVDPADILTYIKDKLSFSASKCQPFITLGEGVELPEKGFCVLHKDYHDKLSEPLQDLKLGRSQVIEGDDRHQILFYKAQIGCQIHLVDSMLEYEGRYTTVKAAEIEINKIPGKPSTGLPQIPIHQSSDWEGVPEGNEPLFLISGPGMKKRSKVDYYASLEKRVETVKATAETANHIRDFALGLAFDHIILRDDANGRAAFWLNDDQLQDDRAKRLGRFRDQAFSALLGRDDSQKIWLRDSWQKSFDELREEREHEKLQKILGDHVEKLDVESRNATGADSEQVRAHLAAEKSAIEAFCKSNGIEID